MNDYPTIHDLQLIYQNRKEREFYFGTEFYAEDNNGDNVTSLNPEIIFRTQNEVLTGGTNWRGKQLSVPGINLLLKNIEPAVVSEYLQNESQGYLHLKPVIKGTVALTAKAGDKQILKTYQSEIEMKCAQLEGIRSNFNIRSDWNHFLDATVVGAIPDMIELYGFAARRGIKHTALSITFS
jgi:hypothetical protein